MLIPVNSGVTRKDRPSCKVECCKMVTDRVHVPTAAHATDKGARAALLPRAGALSISSKIKSSPSHVLAVRCERDITTGSRGRLSALSDRASIMVVCDGTVGALWRCASVCLFLPLSRSVSLAWFVFSCTPRAVSLSIASLAHVVTYRMVLYHMCRRWCSFTALRLSGTTPLAERPHRCAHSLTGALTLHLDCTQTL